MIARVTYVYEIYVKGECVCQWKTARPMGPLARGDFLSPRTFSTSEYPGLDEVLQRREILQIRWLEHLINFGMRWGRELVHHTMIDCVAVPDTWEMRHRAFPGGLLYCGEDD